MRLRIDQFYLHPRRGVIKFLGFNKDGLLVIERYDKWGDEGWLPQNRLEFERAVTKMKEIPPPQ
jgi:hypothetical protein